MKVYTLKNPETYWQYISRIKSVSQTNPTQTRLNILSRSISGRKTKMASRPNAMFELSHTHSI